MYSRLTSDEGATAPDETKVKERTGNARESTSLSTAATPDSYGSTTVQSERSGTAFYVPRCALTLYIMITFGIFCTLALRSSLNESIVAMMNHTAIAERDGLANASDDKPCYHVCQKASKHVDGELKWDRQEQALVLSAFYIGHIFALIPGGWLTDKFGGRWFFGGCILLSSVIALLTPVAARTHISIITVLRILSGFGEAVLYPSVQSLIARWTLPKHRSAVIATVITAGEDAGNFLGIFMSGLLAEYGFAGGWPSVFYVFGTLGCLCSITCFFLCHSSPSTHPWISKTELEYWEKQLGTVNLAVHPPTPWKKILTSVPVWALAAAFFTDNWGSFTLSMCIPMYLSDAFGFSMFMNGIVAALPFLVSAAIDPFTGLLADWLRAPGRLSTNVVRKVLIVVGFTISACSFALISFTGCNRGLIILLVILAAAGSGVSYPNVVTNVQDLASLHAGKLMGLAWTIVTLSAIGPPSLVGALTRRQKADGWRTMFFITDAIYVVGGAVFVIFGSVKPQQWAEAIEDDRELQLQSTDSKQSENKD